MKRLMIVVEAKEVYRALAFGASFALATPQEMQRDGKK